MAAKTNRVVIGRLNELIGGEAARKLAVIYGGTKLYFSESKLCFMRLALIMGEERARKLIAEFNGMSIEVPRYSDAIKKERADEAKADRGSGMTVREVALKHELTERSARMILNERP